MRKVNLKAKYVLVQVPVTIFLIWFGGWLLYHYFQFWRYIKSYVYMNVLGSLMVVMVFLLLELAKRISLSKQPQQSTGLSVCPGCKEPLDRKSQLKPFKVVYSCQNPNCRLGHKKRKTTKKKP